MVGYEIKNTHTLPRVYNSDKKLLYKLKDDTENIQQQIDDLPDIVQSDWNIEDATNMAFIKNKPNVPILDESGQIPAAYLPSYVDDVLEGYYYNNKFYKESTHTTEITPQVGKIYVDLSTDIAYRWGGSTYVEISKSIVTGVKGDAETNYRIGNINITPTNIGLSNVVNLDQSKAIKTITRSGTTFTYTCLDGTTGTFTQQDTIYTLPLAASGTRGGIQIGYQQSGKNYPVALSSEKAYVNVPWTDTTYSAGTGLSLTNTTFALALTKKLVTDALGYTPPTTDTTYSAGQGLVLNSTTFKLGSGTIAHYSRTGSGSAYIKIAINSTVGWMLSFKVRLYGSYVCDEYIISGYQYGSNHWYSPTVILQNTDGGTRKVIFGYTSVNNLWVAIPDRNYTGCDIIDVVNGYSQVSSFDGLFTLTRIAEADLSTKQSEVTVSPNARKSDIPTSLPASDVYAWAKASTKPSYTLDEVSDGTTRKLTNTWRKVQLNGVDKLGTGTNTNPLNLKAGTNVSITESGGTFTFAATDTTYESKAAASGGTAVSLVTTGEKYTWNNKSNLTLGTTSTTALKGNTKYAGSSTAGGAATSLENFKVTTTTTLTADPGINAIGYVSGLTKAEWNSQQTDGSLYAQWYNAKWGHEIFGDYRTGQIAVRGKNNGTWQAWRKILDSSNYTDYVNTTNFPGLDKTGTSNLTIGTTATTAAAGNHTHATSIAASTGTNKLSLAANTKYAITAGGTSYVFTTPADTNTWRGIQDNLTSSTNTTESLSAKQGYLLANGSARDNTKLPLAGGTLTGKVNVNSSHRDAGMYGVYDSHYLGHVWSMGTGYAISADGKDPASLYGMGYFHTNWSNSASYNTNNANKTALGTYAGGHQIGFFSNGVLGTSIGFGGNVWTSGGFIKKGGTSSQFLKADGSVDSNTYLTSHQDISGKKNVQTAVSDPSASGTSLTFIKTISQNAQGVITPAKATVSTMGAASSSAAGTAGLVPAPAKGKQGSFLKGDGTWSDIPVAVGTGNVTIISNGSGTSANIRYYGYVSMGTYADAKKVISISVYTTNKISTTIDGNFSVYIKTSLSHTFVDSVTIGSTTITNAFLFAFGTSNPGATTYISVYQV